MVLAQVQIKLDARAVVADKTDDLLQRLPRRCARSSDDRNRPQDVQVLVLGHAQAKIRAIELSCGKLQQPDQRTQRYPCFLVHQHVRMDAEALEHEVGLPAKLACHLTESGQRACSDQCSHVVKDQIIGMRGQ
ncbi:hypothetical protein D3C87_1444140 [compost metagenome]